MKVENSTATPFCEAAKKIHTCTWIDTPAHGQAHLRFAAKPRRSTQVVLTARVPPNRYLRPLKRNLSARCQRQIFRFLIDLDSRPRGF